MKRSEVREILFMLLFRAEYNDISEMPEQMQLFFNVDFSMDSEGEDSFIKDGDKEYIMKRGMSILEKLPEIDNAISEKATGWTLERFGKVDLAIVRLAVYEMLYDDDIPTGVAINEAVELAKKYGRDESSGFVNGVLAKFAK